MNYKHHLKNKKYTHSNCYVYVHILLSIHAYISYFIIALPFIPVLVIIIVACFPTFLPHYFYQVLYSTCKLSLANVESELKRGRAREGDLTSKNQELVLHPFHISDSSCRTLLSSIPRIYNIIHIMHTSDLNIYYALVSSLL